MAGLFFCLVIIKQLVYCMSGENLLEKAQRFNFFKLKSISRFHTVVIPFS